VIFGGNVFRTVNAQSLRNIEPRFEEVLSIGDDDSKPAEYLFGEISDVVTDANSNIYIADRMALNIRVFDQNGEYLRTIGGRGRGPGQFQSITDLSVSADGTKIISYDFKQDRITIFKTQGEVVNTFTAGNSYTEMIKPRFDNQGYISLTISPPYKEYSKYLFHEFDQKFVLKNSFGNVSKVSYNQSFANKILRYRPGTFTYDRVGALYYAPGVYDGTIYRYQRNGQSRRAVSEIIRGHKFVEESFYTYKKEEYVREKMIKVSSIDRQTGEVRTSVGRVNSLSAGIHELDGGRIIHFVFVSEEVTEGRLGLEVYDAKDRLSAVGLFPNTVGGKGLPTLEVPWQDEAGRFYVIDRNEAPVVRVVNLVFDE